MSVGSPVPVAHRSNLVMSMYEQPYCTMGVLHDCRLHVHVITCSSGHDVADRRLHIQVSHPLFQQFRFGCRTARPCWQIGIQWLYDQEGLQGCQLQADNMNGKNSPTWQFCGQYLHMLQKYCCQAQSKGLVFMSGINSEEDLFWGRSYLPNLIRIKRHNQELCPHVPTQALLFIQGCHLHTHCRQSMLSL